MKKIIIGIAVLAMAATLLDSCSSCSSRRQAAETELNDSTKAAMEMERKKMEEPEFEMVTSHGTMKL